MMTIEHAVVSFTLAQARSELAFLRDLDTSEYDGFSYQSWCAAIEEFERIVRDCERSLAES